MAKSSGKNSERAPRANPPSMTLLPRFSIFKRMFREIHRQFVREINDHLSSPIRFAPSLSRVLREAGCEGSLHKRGDKIRPIFVRHAFYHRAIPRDQILQLMGRKALAKTYPELTKPVVEQYPVKLASE